MQLVAMALWLRLRDPGQITRVWVARWVAGFVGLTSMVGSFCWFGFWFLLFTRLLPPIAIQELKEVLPPPMRKKKSPEAAEAH